MVFAVVFSLVVIWVLMEFALPRYVDFCEQKKVVSIENSNHEVLAYLFAYVIPFISVADKKRLYVLSVLLLMTFVLFYKSEILKYNIYLLLLGYDIIKLELDDGSIKFFLKKTTLSIKRNDIVIYGEISRNLYLIESK